jgi:hypothetical protein
LIIFRFTADPSSWQFCPSSKSVENLVIHKYSLLLEITSYLSIIAFSKPSKLFNTIHIQLKIYQNEVHHSGSPASSAATTTLAAPAVPNPALGPSPDYCSYGCKVRRAFGFEAAPVLVKEAVSILTPRFFPTCYYSSLPIPAYFQAFQTYLFSPIRLSSSII